MARAVLMTFESENVERRQSELIWPKYLQQLKSLPFKLSSR
jgi:hypothetical protein